MGHAGLNLGGMSLSLNHKEAPSKEHILLAWNLKSCVFWNWSMPVSEFAARRIFAAPFTLISGSRGCCW